MTLLRELLTWGGLLGIFGFAFREIFLTVKDARSRQAIESHEILKAKVEKFTSKYGERFEDRDDTVQERAS